MKDEDVREFLRYEDIMIFVEMLKSFQISSETIAEKLMEKFDLTENEVHLFVNQE